MPVSIDYASSRKSITSSQSVKSRKVVKTKNELKEELMKLGEVRRSGGPNQISKHKLTVYDPELQLPVPLPSNQKSLPL
jgi:hypothetical protein